MMNLSFGQQSCTTVECGIAETFCSQVFNIDVRNLQHLVNAFLLFGNQRFTVLVNEYFAVEHEVGTAFAEPTADIYVSCKQAGTLICHHLSYVIVLACAAGRCTQVEDDVGSL